MYKEKSSKTSNMVILKDMVHLTNYTLCHSIKSTKLNIVQYEIEISKGIKKSNGGIKDLAWLYRV